MTSIEWLNEQMNNIKGSSINMNGRVQFIEKELNNLFDQAKEMEKERAVDFAYDIADDLACGVFSKKDIEDRYTEFFKSE